MAIRLIKILLPPSYDNIDSLLSEEEGVHSWVEKAENGVTSVYILADVELTENLIDELESKFAGYDNYRIILMPVAATLPELPSDEEEETGKESPVQQEENEDKRVKRISKEELYEDIKQVVDSSWVYFVLIALSCVVAANGLIRDSAAMVIGAMVIAPILGPNVGLALATTLGDKVLMKRSMKSITYGFFLVLLLSVLMGLAIDFSPDVYEIDSRTSVSFADIALGLAAGVAGCLSFTRGISAAVIGVMVAVALLPPLVATGLLAGSGDFELAMGAGILTITYIICVNLAGIITFLLQGIKPRSFMQQREGEELSRYAIIIWVLLLMSLALIIYFQYS